MSSGMTVLRSFHGDPAVKRKYVERLRAHHAADELIHGSYWDAAQHRGCAVGCTIEGDDHSRYETELGIPKWLAQLEDRIFEGLPIASAKDFARDFLEAIPVGSDLTPVRWRFLVYVQKQNIRIVESLSLDESLSSEVLDAIRDVLRLQETAGETGEWDESAASSAARSAWSAALSAARSAWSAESAESAASSAAWSAESAWSAAGSAAWSAALSAWSAARSAAESSAWSAWSSARSADSAGSAWSAAFQFQAGVLLDLLREAGS